MIVIIERQDLHACYLRHMEFLVDVQSYLIGFITCVDLHEVLLLILLSFFNDILSDEMLLEVSLF